jgi:hypothetical protein
MKDILMGQQLGEFFGTSIASGDFNGDGLDDLVIGSPQFTTEKQGYATQNEGRVAVYVGSFTVNI